MEKREIVMQKKLNVTAFLGFASLWVVFAAPSVFATALGDLANSMTPGQWKQLSTIGFNNSLLVSPNGHHILQYTSNMHWDPINKRVLYLGAGHMSPFRFIQYTESTNTWTELTPPTSEGIHSYDHNALDPRDGAYYHRVAGSNTVRKYSGGSWSVIPSMSVSYQNIADGLEVDVARNGLYFYTGTPGELWFFNLATSSWSLVGSFATGNQYHNFVEYSAFHQIAIFGGGNGSSQVYRVLANGSVSPGANAPFELAISTSVVTSDPVTGDFLAISGSGAFYSYSPITNVWTAKATPPASIRPSDINGVTGTAISAYGVTMFTRYNGDASEVWLYKNANSGAPAPSDTVAPSTPTNLTAAPAGSSQINLSWTASTDNLGVAGYRIYRNGVQETTVTTTSFQSTGLTASTTYSYTVSAYDAAGNSSSPFAAVSATTSAASGGSTGRTIHLYQGNGFEAAVESLQPGDTLTVHQGTYSDTGKISITVKGTAQAPVVIKAADGESRPVITRSSYDALQNTINIDGATYLTIKGLEITGNGADGISVSPLNGDPSHLTLEDLDIHDIDIGISVRSIDNLVVRRCHIYRKGRNQGTGEGMYIGCNYAACIAHDSLIEGNWIHDDLPGIVQGDGIEVKPGSYNNIVRDNVIYNVSYPGILVYGGGAGINTVEGNAIWNTAVDGIQVVADAIVRNNIIVHAGTGIGNYGHEQVAQMRNTTIVNNTVYSSTSECLFARYPGSQSNIVLANNAFYCPSTTAADVIGINAQVTYRSNYVQGSLLNEASIDSLKFFTGGTAASAFISPAIAPPMNFWPTTSSVLRNNANATYIPSNDFNWTARTSPYDVGAYETQGLAVNPGWTIAPGFKSSPQLPGDTTPPAPPGNLQAN